MEEHKFFDIKFYFQKIKDLMFNDSPQAVVPPQDWVLRAFNA